MTTPDFVEPASADEPRATAPEGAGVADAADAQQTAPEPEIVQSEVQVEIQRSVRWGRLLIVGAILGAAIAGLLSLSFPVMEKADYTLPQVTGFMLVIGAALGLGVGGLLAMVLNQVAKRKHGRGVAIQTDVR